ncbi:hypothetical protein J132_08837, partial [Termitomyces sp. J132]
SAILTQLWTGHAPLNAHLFRIKRSESLACPHCQGLTVETVQHFLLECSHYNRKQFTHLTRVLKRKAESIPHLLSAPDALKHLTRYIEATKRFHAPKGTPLNQRQGLCPLLPSVLGQFQGFWGLVGFHLWKSRSSSGALSRFFRGSHVSFSGL